MNYSTRILFLYLWLIVFAPKLEANTYRISVLTCAQGDDLYATFGHSAIRVVDSTNHTDIVYNYGTFNFNNPDFYVKFVKGDLLYFIEACDYNSFTMMYAYEQRSVTEQVLAVDSTEQNQIVSYLNENLLEQYKYYKYDFVNDNCATRVYQVFDQLFTQHLNCHSVKLQKTHRSILNEMLIKQDWTRLGINLMLGKRVDQPITTKQSFFIPKYLELGLKTTDLNNKKLVVTENKLLQFDEQATHNTHYNQPLLVFIALLLVLLLSYYLRSLSILYSIISSAYLITSSLLGIVFLCMWFWSSHISMHDNYNVLWALPTHCWLVIKPKNKSKYVMIALVLICISILFHFVGIQKLPNEIIPFILGLFFILLTKWKKHA
jgi:hypothetical protein